MRIAAVSDLHGHLPEIPECDLLVLAGDICPDCPTRETRFWRGQFQREWLRKEFVTWFEQQPVGRAVMVWGNHDIVGEEFPWFEMDLNGDTNYRLEVLTDRLVEWEGLSVYGMPWSREFFPENWAFNLTDLRAAPKCEAIPHCDILVTHGPPFGYLDQTKEGNTGFKSLRERVHDIKPAHTFCGHIHEWGGNSEAVWQPTKDSRKWPLIHNVAYVDEHYRPREEPILVIEWERPCRTGAESKEEGASPEPT